MRLFRISSKKRRRNVFSILGGVAFGLVVSLLIFFVTPFTTLRENLTDLLYLPSTTPPNVVIAAIDEKSLSEVGKRIPEWPRSLHATAVDNLAAAGAQVIAFDVLFAEESDDDADLERAVREAGNVIMPVAGIVVREGTELAGTFVTPPLISGEYQFTRFVKPKPEFIAASIGLGHANMPPGPGDKVRHIAITASTLDGDRYPTLSAAAVMVQFRGDPTTPIEAKGDGFARITTNPNPRFPRKEVPVNDARGMRVNFTGGPGTMPSISYIEIINNTFDPDDVRGKIVFIGATAAAIGDTKATPIGDEMPGVEVHANAADTICASDS